ncbi:tyrosine-type recombinase/integrase [Enterococcus wangshanyuanii]|uniref:Site-specific integrase n=1 Tax=Enterococcus wangshanyuanii TaxID=2005703 RepID=A0ABQ1PVE8_9ENTE|nr:site-specific integrase [Enterococcus wangshanyuanii]GGD04817.1 site-specific integrase [Enterococcus wangshanyuanii]
MAKPKKLKNGMYSYRYKVKSPISGKWIDKYTTQFTAQQCYDAEIKAKNDALMGISPERMLLIPFFDLWVDTFKKGIVGPDHLGKINATRKSLIDFFGKDITLKSIDRIKYQRWINHMGIDLNHAKKTVSDKHKIAKAMFTEAIDSGYLYQNPANKAKIIGRDTTGERKKTLSIEEWLKLKEVILSSEESASKYISLIMMYLGTRFQETTGLTKKDFDFKNHTLSINKAFDYKRTKKNTTTKTVNSVRVVDLPTDLEIILRDYIAKLDQSKKVIKLHAPTNDYLFTNDFGEPITNAAINKYLAKKCKLAKIQKITSHAFRHARVDLLVLAGSDMIYTQKQLGHKDASVTLQYYSTLNQDIRDKNKLITEEFLKSIDGGL